jgi:hypothetical protein
MVRLTGYSARGMYDLANDYIISAYNCHYHEIAHLLMNYKLKSLSLYTLPLFQEGFAVAYGGRGGKEPAAILEMGLFMVKSQFLDYDSLLNKAGFNQYDASVSYPVAGLYTQFLIETIGIEKYLDLYTNYTAAASEIDRLQINSNNLPSGRDWQVFLKRMSVSNPIGISGFKEKDFPKAIYSGEDAIIRAGKETYLIKLKDRIGFWTPDQFRNYRSICLRNYYPELSIRAKST